MAHGRRRQNRCRCVVLIILLCCCAVGGCKAFRHSGPRRGVHAGSGFHSHSPVWEGPEPIYLCSEHYRNTTLDHFAWDPSKGLPTYPQRYFLCDSYWKSGPDGEKGPIFVYLGNEADVTLYLNATGLMWENAPNFGALLVFVEHRYYGKSIPQDSNTTKQFLTTEQAIADYAEFITDLKAEVNATHSPVIGFGGSYGGMIAAWMRMKYPHILDGVIAGSAPIWTFFGENPPVDPGYFGKIVTYDASPAAGSAAACVPNVQKAWSTILEMAETVTGSRAVKKAMTICDSVGLEDTNSALALMEWVSDAFDMMAMGMYPYASNYMTNGQGYLPAYPIRVACSFMAEPLTGVDLLSGLAKAAGLLYNSTGDVECFDFTAAVNNATAEVDNLWKWQSCTEMVIPDSRDGVNDMFWKRPFDLEEYIDTCLKTVGILPRPLWAQIQWGGRLISTASNIVFSNGEYDPWRGGGVTSHVSDSITVFTIAESGHHVDLMFSHPEDTDAIKAARALEVTSITKWIAEARQNNRPPPEVATT